ncbi:DNA polymerase III subunit delta [Phormidium sp. FACHB-1136]|uniref:DNA polymerase III subunit delta n=1 Tax=Phormidium sp. FACHB-1136 TaxID=2692848 RepID=UPI001685FFB2|nr:DNA polymerase III subunit delta [Phormidium sp. FACHB-1136]MBD2424372.1 DNA polymerase III subunit delta [Phormidium sp. FACHB-1136]
MPAYFFWGDDDFQLQAAVQALRQETLDEAWASFNYEVFPPSVANGPIQALNQVMTPPFGLGKRLVWLQNTALGQRCPDEVLAELERTLPGLPSESVLLLTSAAKPDGRSKFYKLFKKHGEIREFAVIPPWKTDLIRQQVETVAKARSLNLTPKTIDLLAEAVGNDTRQLHIELEKLALFWNDPQRPIPPEAAADLVTVSTQNSLKLAQAAKQGDTQTALSLVEDLLNRNEPALRMVATLVSQFRLWLWLKVMEAERVTSEAEIAAAAEIANPKRIYFLRQEIRGITLAQLQRSLPLLLELESELKLGRDERATLQTKVIELCRVFRPVS